MHLVQHVTSARQKGASLALGILQQSRHRFSSIPFTNTSAFCSASPTTNPALPADPGRQQLHRPIGKPGDGRKDPLNRPTPVLSAYSLAPAASLDASQPEYEAHRGFLWRRACILRRWSIRETNRSSDGIVPTIAGLRVEAESGVPQE